MVCLPAPIYRGLKLLPGDSPLRTAANILLTSHTAWYSEDSVQDARVEAVESVIEVLGE
jgi:phosphoglycerate dehydrogenase-like enzyme